MSDHFPLTTAARNMLLLAKWAHNNYKAEKIWPDPMKLENCMVLRSPYTLWGCGDVNFIEVVWNSDSHYCPRHGINSQDFSYHSCKSLGLRGDFIFKSTLKSRPEGAGISGAAAEVDQSLRWEDLAVPVSQLSCVHVQGGHPLLTWKRTATAECCTLSENPRCL